MRNGKDEDMEPFQNPAALSAQSTKEAGGPEAPVEGAVLSSEALSARLRELERDVCNLQQVVCHLLLKNETLRQRIQGTAQERVR